MPITTDPVYGTVDINSESHRVVLGGSTAGGSQSPHGLTYDADRFNTAGELEVSILAESTPPEDAEVSCSIRGESIFTGTITKAERRAGGYVHLIANDVVHDLKRATLSQSFQEADIQDIATAALDAVGASYSVDLPDETTSGEFSDERCDKIIEKCSDWGHAVWTVTEQNVLQLTQTVSAISSAYDLEHVIDAAPGERAMPYQSVQVEGTSPASRRGRPSMHLISSGSVVATVGEGDPTFRHQDSRIKTQSMADNAAQAIYDELQRQQATGPITLAGDARIRPYDTVTLPEHIDSGECLVSSVQHRLTARDGFRTTIQCGGVVS